MRGVILSSVRAVVARAFYAEQQERVRAFASILVTGEMGSSSDPPAILMRNNLLMTPSTSRGVNRTKVLKVSQLFKCHI